MKRPTLAQLEHRVLYLKTRRNTAKTRYINLNQLLWLAEDRLKERQKELNTRKGL